MIKFNYKGLLEPDMAISSSIEEMKIHFVDNISNKQREVIYSNYFRYANELKNVCSGVQITQWIDGSFVTKKNIPGDIDLVSFIPYDQIQKKERLLVNFKYPNSLSVYNVDAYIIITYPETHRLYYLFLADRVYWINQFSKTKRNRIGKRYPKGFLEIIL